MQLLTGAEKDGNVTLRYCHMTYKCLNRAYHSCDKPLEAKVFIILNPSRMAGYGKRTCFIPGTRFGPSQFFCWWRGREKGRKGEVGKSVKEVKAARQKD